MSYNIKQALARVTSQASQRSQVSHESLDLVDIRDALNESLDDAGHKDLARKLSTFEYKNQSSESENSVSDKSVGSKELESSDTDQSQLTVGKTSQDSESTSSDSESDGLGGDSQSQTDFDSDRSEEINLLADPNQLDETSLSRNETNDGASLPAADDIDPFGGPNVDFQDFDELETRQNQEGYPILTARRRRLGTRRSKRTANAMGPENARLAEIANAPTKEELEAERILQERINEDQRYEKFIQAMEEERNKNLNRSNMADTTCADPYDTSCFNTPETFNQGGSILKLRLVDFMSHKNFEWDFQHKPINFICGKNGSGKSAILQAIVLAFNGGSARTGKDGASSARNNLHFIREGRKVAKVRLWVNNDCCSSYRQDDYGEKIQINVTLSKFVSKTGKISVKTEYETVGEYETTISKSVREVNEIVAHFRIAIKNPIVVLSQERAKNFIHDYNPEKMYALFEETTNIKESNAHLHTQKRHIEEITKFIEDKNVELKELKHRKTMWNERYNAVMHEEENETLRHDICIEIVYSHLAVEFKKTEDKKEKLEKKREEIKKMDEKCNDLKSEGDVLLGKITEYNSEIVALEGNKTECDEEIKKLNETKAELEEEYKGTAFDKATLETSVEELEVKVEQLKAMFENREKIYLEKPEIKKMKGNKSKIESYEIINEKLDSEVFDLRNENFSLNSEVKALKADISKTEKRKVEISRKVKSFAQKMGAVRSLKATHTAQKTVDKKSKSSQASMSQSHNILTQCILGREGCEDLDAEKTKVENFLKAITLNSNKIFLEEPIGPMEKFIKVKARGKHDSNQQKIRQNWAPVLENRVLNSICNTWICASDKDARNLLKVAKNFDIENIKTVVLRDIGSRVSADDKRANRPAKANRPNWNQLSRDPGWHIAFDLLDIQNDHVHNAILQFTNANSTFLIYETKKAANFSRRLHPSLFCYDDEGRSFSKTRFGGPLKKADKVSLYLEPDFDSQLKILEEDFNKAENDENDIESEIKSLNSVKVKKYGQYQENNDIIQRKLSSQKANKESIKFMEDVNNKISTSNSYMPIETLKSEYCDENDRLKQMKFKLGGHFEQTDAEKAYKNFIEQRLVPMKERKAEIKGQIDEIRKILEGSSGRGGVWSKGLRKNFREIRDRIWRYEERGQKKLLEDEEKYLDKFEEAVHKYNFEKGQAIVTVGSEVENPRDLDFLQKEEKRICNEIKRLKECSGYSKEQLQEALSKTYKKYKQLKFEVSGRKVAKRDLKGSLNRLENYLETEKQSIAQSCECIFRYHCAQNGFSGRLKVEHAKTTFNKQTELMQYESRGEITFRVQPPERDSDIDAKSLSGGERSYVTVCFVATLWNMIDTPFKFLDEFDVFMDVKNREMAVNLLYESCRLKDNKGKQYFLLTPNDISSREVIPNFNSEMCDVFRLKDPERRDFGVEDDEIDGFDKFNGRGSSSSSEDSDSEG